MNPSESEFKALMSSTKVEGTESTSQQPTAMSATGLGSVTTATSTDSTTTATTAIPIENPYTASAPVYEETIYEEHGDVTVRPAGERDRSRATAAPALRPSTRRSPQRKTLHELEYDRSSRASFLNTIGINNQFGRNPFREAPLDDSRSGLNLK